MIVSGKIQGVCKKHLPFGEVRVKIFGSDQVAETCDACDRTEDLSVLRFSIYADFDQQFLAVHENTQNGGIVSKKGLYGTEEGCR